MIQTILMVRRPFHATRLSVAALGLASLSGCGGDSSPQALVTRQESQLARRVVASADMPNLYRCLSELGAALRKDAGRSAASLACASGTYRGLTGTGRHCELQIDGVTGVFRFTLEREAVSMRRENLAHAVDGSALHNLGDASAPDQPGIQLTRFTGAPVPLTETMTLRFTGRLPSLPQMIYRLSGDGKSGAVLCSFGK